jgi:hypothetical protein
MKNNSRFNLTEGETTILGLKLTVSDIIFYS